MKKIILILFVCYGYLSFGQCSGFQTKNCELPFDWPYEYDSQSIGAGMFPGQIFRIKVVLYEENDYYIGFCINEDREKFQFNIKLEDLDLDQKYENNGNDNLWKLDLTVEKTMIATIEVKLNKNKTINYDRSELECFGIIIGNKLSE